MEKLKIKLEFERLFYPEDLAQVMESYKLVTDAAFEIVAKQKDKILNCIEDVDAGHLFQMTILKNLSVYKLAESLNYSNGISNFDMFNIYDPFALNNIIRTQYEAFCNFNNIYKLSKSKDEMQLKYNLWVICGLKYRQSFSAELEENIQKKEAERIEITEITNRIENSQTFLNLNEKSKINIRKGINQKKWQISVNDRQANIIGWHQMLKNSGANQMLDGQYTFLSLNTHPSNVSVFQFKDMYSDKRDLSLSILSIKLSKWLISLFIADYCYYFKDAKETFDNLPIITQMLINSYNFMLRGESYRINAS